MARRDALRKLTAAVLARVPRAAAVSEKDIASGKVLSVRQARKLFESHFGRLFDALDRAIGSELPPLLEGLNASEIKKVLRKKFDNIFEKTKQL